MSNQIIFTIPHPYYPQIFYPQARLEEIPYETIETRLNEIKLLHQYTCSLKEVLANNKRVKIPQKDLPITNFVITEITNKEKEIEALQTVDYVLTQYFNQRAKQSSSTMEIEEELSESDSSDEELNQLITQLEDFKASEKELTLKQLPPYPIELEIAQLESQCPSIYAWLELMVFLPKSSIISAYDMLFDDLKKLKDHDYFQKISATIKQLKALEDTLTKFDEYDEIKIYIKRRMSIERNLQCKILAKRIIAYNSAPRFRKKDDLSINQQTFTTFKNTYPNHYATLEVLAYYPGPLLPLEGLNIYETIELLETYNFISKYKRHVYITPQAKQMILDLMTMERKKICHAEAKVLEDKWEKINALASNSPSSFQWITIIACMDNEHISTLCHAWWKARFAKGQAKPSDELIDELYNLNLITQKESNKPPVFDKDIKKIIRSKIRIRYKEAFLAKADFFNYLVQLDALKQTYERPRLKMQYLQQNIQIFSDKIDDLSNRVAKVLTALRERDKSIDKPTSPTMKIKQALFFLKKRSPSVTNISTSSISGKIKTPHRNRSQSEMIHPETLLTSVGPQSSQLTKRHSMYVQKQSHFTTPSLRKDLQEAASTQKELGKLKTALRKIDKEFGGWIKALTKNSEYVKICELLEYSTYQDFLNTTKRSHSGLFESESDI